jgi:hypothetical protein
MSLLIQSRLQKVKIRQPAVSDGRDPAGLADQFLNTYYSAVPSLVYQRVRVPRIKALGASRRRREKTADRSLGGKPERAPELGMVAGEH